MNGEGNLVGSTFYGYGTEYAHTGWAEQNPDDWWQAICTSTQQLLKETGTRGDDIACVTFSGQMMGCVPLNQQPGRSAKPLSGRSAFRRAGTMVRDSHFRLKPCIASPAIA